MNRPNIHCFKSLMNKTFLSFPTSSERERMREKYYFTIPTKIWWKNLLISIVVYIFSTVDCVWQWTILHLCCQGDWWYRGISWNSNKKWRVPARILWRLFSQGLSYPRIGPMQMHPLQAEKLCKRGKWDFLMILLRHTGADNTYQLIIFSFMYELWYRV